MATPAIDALLRQLVERGGSDLHLCAGRRPMIRESGNIQPLDSEPLSDDVVGAMLREIMPARNQQEFEQVGDSDFAYEIEQLARFRGNAFRDRFGVGGVFRVIPAEIWTAEQLGLPKAVTDLCFLSKGLVLVTGPTGSGKSTTLAAMIDLINRQRDDHLITIEDPVEFVHHDKRCLINQREIHTHTESFAAALRAALRQDPDIVMVGEMRDLETIEIAIETAETGHLVFGTLHTTTAASTVDRIIDAFPADRQSQIRTMLATSLKGVVSQTLCKKTGGGRVAALEVLLVNVSVAAMIRDHKSFQIPSAMQVGGADGMVMLTDSLSNLVASGWVTPEEAYIRAVDKESLLSKFRKHGIEVRALGGQAAAPAGTEEEPTPPENRPAAPETEPDPAPEEESPERKRGWFGR